MNTSNFFYINHSYLSTQYTGFREGKFIKVNFILVICYYKYIFAILLCVLLIKILKTCIIYNLFLNNIESPIALGTGFEPIRDKYILSSIGRGSTVESGNFP